MRRIHDIGDLPDQHYLGPPVEQGRDGRGSYREEELGVGGA
jgi:hypothetical protein